VTKRMLRLLGFLLLRRELGSLPDEDGDDPPPGESGVAVRP